MTRDVKEWLQFIQANSDDKVAEELLRGLIGYRGDQRRDIKTLTDLITAIQLDQMAKENGA